MSYLFRIPPAHLSDMASDWIAWRTSRQETPRTTSPTTKKVSSYYYYIAVVGGSAFFFNKLFILDKF